MIGVFYSCPKQLLSVLAAACITHAGFARSQRARTSSVKEYLNVLLITHSSPLLLLP
jgi:hypothetical protein